jgi:thiol-disulfide isomerase/thioredoxin
MRAKAISIILPLIAAAGFAAAQTAAPAAKPGPTLKPGDEVTIDALKSARWIQGKAPESWEPGKLYIIECWATWCGPCVGIIPHMNELFKKHSGKGLRVTGMNVWESRERSDDPEKIKAANEKAFKKASAFVEGRGAGMSYPVAFASRDSDFATSWLKAAGVRGIPHAFVVKDGKLLFTVHPSRLDDETITALLAGGDAQTKVIENLKAQDRSRAQTGAIMKEFREAMRTEDPEKMAAALAKLEKATPGAPFLPQMRIDLAVVKKDWDLLSKTVKSIGTGPNAMRVLGSLAYRFGGKPDTVPENTRKTIADQFAQALGKSPANPTGFVVLSRLYSTLGDKESALKAAQDATANCGTMPAEPFVKFAKSVEDGKPTAVSEVFTQLRKAMMKQAKEKSAKADRELKKNIEQKQKDSAAKPE